MTICDDNENLFTIMYYYTIMYCYFSKIQSNNLGQYNRPRVLGCEPVDGVLVVLSSNQLNIATFVHQRGDTHIFQLVNKRSNIYLI